MKLQVALVLGALCAAIARVQAQDPKSTYKGSAGLNDVAKGSGRYMGTATDAFFDSRINNDAVYMTELKNKKDWGMITPGNCMKPDSIQHNKGQFDYSRADKVVALAKAAGIRVRCHTLLWHTQVPGWMNTGNNATMLQALTDHITNVMTHFKDDCYAWDVVNEVVDDNGGYRKSFWYNTAGASYIAHAFKTADGVRKKLGLKTKLYYNDYSIEWEGSAKTKFAQQMVKGLVDQKVGIDGVGLQSHFTVGGTPSKSSLMNIMNYYTAMGLDVAVTELDIRTKMPPTSDKKQQQVKDYNGVIAACKATAKCVGVTIWDFVDKYSWVPSTFSGEGYALPFEAPNGGGDYVRKPVYDAIIDGWGGAAAAAGESDSSTTAPPSTTATPSTTTTPSTTATPNTTAPSGNPGAPSFNFTPSAGPTFTPGTLSPPGGEATPQPTTATPKPTTVKPKKNCKRRMRE